jgi:hypothetical protein
MPPEPLTPSPETQAPSPRRKSLLFMLLVAVILVAIVSSVVWIAAPRRNLTWLTPAEATPATPPAFFNRVRNQIRSLVWPWWQRFRRVQPQINIESDLVVIMPQAVQQMALGAPASTNALGLRGWVLGPQDFTALQQRLKSNPGAIVRCRPQIITSNGRPARSVLGSSGFSLDVSIDPKIIGSEIRLLIGAVATEQTEPAGAKAGNVRTNLAVACRVLVSSAGGLVVNAAGATNAAGGSYWLMISPTAVDARGNPLKL